jgi:hypothetical protein
MTFGLEDVALASLSTVLVEGAAETSVAVAERARRNEDRMVNYRYCKSERCRYEPAPGILPCPAYIYAMHSIEEPLPTDSDG